MDSIAYYNENSQEFCNRTLHADLNDMYEKFLSRIPSRGRVLDAGCGVGRDAKFFLSRGYEVVAFDGALEMVKLASVHTGREVQHLLFEELNFSNAFDGIWANASLLHVPYENLRETLERFHQALLPSGILYGSFKYGSSMRQEGGRTFFDMDEDAIRLYLGGLFQPLEIWKSADTRSQVAPSPDNSWLNFLARRTDPSSQ